VSWIWCTFHINAGCRWPECSSSLRPDFRLSWRFIDISKSSPSSSVFSASVPHRACEISHNRSVCTVCHCCHNNSSGILQVLFLDFVVTYCVKLYIYSKLACLVSLIDFFVFSVFLPSVLWCCWLGSRKGIRPVKNWVVGCWHGYMSGSRCRSVYGPADATATHYFLLQ